MFVRPTQVVLLDEAGNPMETSLEERQLPRSRLSRSVVLPRPRGGLIGGGGLLRSEMLLLVRHRCISLFLFVRTDHLRFLSHRSALLSFWLPRIRIILMSIEITPNPVIIVYML